MSGKLTNQECLNARYSPKGDGNKLADGGGLYLHLKQTGKYWRMDYRFIGKRKTLTIGPYPKIGLKQAREKRNEAKTLIEEGKDPCEQKKIGKLSLITAYENNFENIAREWHEQKKHTWQPKHAQTILSRMEGNLFPLIGARPITQIKPTELLDAIRRIEKKGLHDLAHRQLQHCSQIFRYAVATGRADYDITPNLKGALKPAKSRNLAHLSEKELPVFLQKLERYDSDYNGSIITKLAFQFMILTFVRSREIRGAKWDEIDWQKKEWRIPAERMKMKEQHIVPLAKQSIALLRQVQKISGNNRNGMVFPSLKNPAAMLSENTFLKAIAVMGYKGKTTGHGFRSTASTILNERGFRSDVIERQLAHCERNQVRAAYNHAEYLSERHEMMKWWADYINGLTLK